MEINQYCDLHESMEIPPGGAVWLEFGAECCGHQQ